MSTLRIQPFAFRSSPGDTRKCRLLFAVGLAYGHRSASEPSVRIGLWLTRHYRIRKREPYRSGLRETWSPTAYWLTCELGSRDVAAKLAG